jgi:hypothetical protein
MKLMLILLIMMLISLVYFFIWRYIYIFIFIVYDIFRKIRCTGIYMRLYIYEKKYLYLSASSLETFWWLHEPQVTSLISIMCNHIELHCIVFFTVIILHVYKYIRKSYLSFHWNCTYIVYCNYRDIYI